MFLPVPDPDSALVAKRGLHHERLQAGGSARVSCVCDPHP